MTIKMSKDEFKCVMDFIQQAANESETIAQLKKDVEEANKLLASSNKK